MNNINLDVLENNIKENSYNNLYDACKRLENKGFAYFTVNEYVNEFDPIGYIVKPTRYDSEESGLNKVQPHTQYYIVHQNKYASIYMSDKNALTEISRVYKSISDMMTEFNSISEYEY